ncbi:MAG TPA: hypothetical protein VH419_05585 [Nocardioidaceae bacterium]|jgi:hypothetical protein
MTTSPQEPLKSARPRSADTSEEAQNERDERLVEQTPELSEPGGYDDRQESLKESDQDLFERKQHDPDASYKDEDLPKSEPRKQPRQQP